MFFEYKTLQTIEKVVIKVNLPAKHHLPLARAKTNKAAAVRITNTATTIPTMAGAPSSNTEIKFEKKYK